MSVLACDRRGCKSIMCDRSMVQDDEREESLARYNAVFRMRS